VRTALGLIIIVVILIVIVGLLWRRRTRDEIHSIDHYRNALETLHGMRPDGTGRSVRVLDDDEARSLRQPQARPVIRSQDQTYTRRTIQPPPTASEGMVFDDNEPIHESPFHHERHHGHDSQWAISRAQSRPPLQNRQWIAMGIASSVVLVLLIVGVLIGRSSHSSTTTTSTTIHHQQQKPHTTTTKPTPTTIPSTYQPQPGATATTATYLAPSTRYVLTITATGGGCWTIATGSNNNQLFAGTVSPGTPQQITVTGSAQVSLGAPANVAVTLNGRPVAFPPSYSTPLVLTFQPPVPVTTTTAPPAPSSTTTLPPTTTSTTQKP